MPQDLRKGGRGASARAAGAPLTLLEGRQSWSWMVRVQTSRRARCLDWDRHMGRSRLRLHTGLSGASAASGDWARRGLNRTQIEHKSRSSLVPANQKDAGLQVISLVGETGFEPATARPPARGIGCRSVDEARIHWVFCFRVLCSFAQFVPQSVPQTLVWVRSVGQRQCRGLADNCIRSCTSGAAARTPRARPPVAPR